MPICGQRLWKYFLSHFLKYLKNSYTNAISLHGKPFDLLLTEKEKYNQNPKVMRSLLYLIAIILIIGWLLGAFVYSVGGLIHILLVIAIISILLGVIRRA